MSDAFVGMWVAVPEGKSPMRIAAIEDKAGVLWRVRLEDGRIAHLYVPSIRRASAQIVGLLVESRPQSETK